MCLKSGVSFTLVLSLFNLRYTKTWQVYIVRIELPNPEET